MTAAEKELVFRNSASSRWQIGTAVAIVAFGALILWHTITNAALGYPTRAAIVAVGLAIPLFQVVRLARGGVACDARGVVVRNPVRHVRLSWEEIDRFEIHPGTIVGNTAWVHKRDGGRIHIFGIVANMSRKAADEAQPIVDALNERLAEERHAAMAADGEAHREL